LTGAGICLLQKTVYRGAQKITEVRVHQDTRPLGHYLRLTNDPTVDTASFVRLTEFFLKGGRAQLVCRNVLGQMEEAARQQTWQATELLVSTILEAALKTLDGRPFKQGDDSWKIKPSLFAFRDRYLSREWSNACEKAIKVHFVLRNRNAHPDWLYQEGQPRSEIQKMDVLRDISFLSRFYGYMILALAGFENLRPEFL
jgi:hypothetical protein